MKPVDPEEMATHFHYDSERGVLIWKQNANKTKSWNSSYAGKDAGSLTRFGYIIVCVNYNKILAHRIIWALHNRDSDLQIDHINGVRNDNRISNLRLATESQNQCNSPKYVNNTSGFKGVHLKKETGKFVASISKLGVQSHLGTYITAEEAAAAYKFAAAILHREFARIH